MGKIKNYMEKGGILRKFDWVKNNFWEGGKSGRKFFILEKIVKILLGVDGRIC